jgi:hypothetical protein
MHQWFSESGEVKGLQVGKIADGLEKALVDAPVQIALAVLPEEAEAHGAGQIAPGAQLEIELPETSVPWNEDDAVFQRKSDSRRGVHGEIVHAFLLFFSLALFAPWTGDGNARREALEGLPSLRIRQAERLLLPPIARSASERCDGSKVRLFCLGSLAHANNLFYLESIACLPFPDKMMEAGSVDIIFLQRSCGVISESSERTGFLNPERAFPVRSGLRSRAVKCLPCFIVEAVKKEKRTRFLEERFEYDDLFFGEE